MSKIDKVVIVGGGSAGWLAAAAMCKYFPEKHITLIESEKIPIIGVGESSTAMMKHFINGHLGVSDEEFMPAVNAIYKMAVKFTNFYITPETNSYYYPFGLPLVNNLQPFGIEAWNLTKTFNPNLTEHDFIASMFPAYELFTNNKIDDNDFGQFDNYDPTMDRAYHLDAHLLGDWLRDKYCLPRGVNLIIGDVVSTKINDTGMESVTLDTGESITADLFIDCTGFKRLLLGKEMKPPFIDLSHKLPNNRAWAVPIKYKDVYKEMTPYTGSTALKNGWVWYTPIWSRTGNGYVYCDAYVTPEEALEEFKEHLLSENHPISLSREEVDNLPFFELRMSAGFYQESMIKNVVAIGGAAGFLEPLEGTSLYFVTESLLMLVRTMQRNFLNQYVIDAYNCSIKALYDLWVDALSLIYASSNREDSQYWLDIKNKKFDSSALLDSSLLPHQNWHSYLRRGLTDSPELRAHFDIFSAITYGTNLLARPDESVIDRWALWDKRDYAKEAVNLEALFTERKARWKMNAKSSLSVYDYLKKRIYNLDLGD